VAHRGRAIASADERAYLYARGIVLATLTFLYVSDLLELPDQAASTYYVAAITGFALVGALQVWAFLIRRIPLQRTMPYALPFDLVCIGLFTSALAESGNLGYPLAITWPVLYALVMRRRQAWVAGGLTAIIYLVGMLSVPLESWAQFAELTIRALVIVAVSGRIAYSEELQREREEQAQRANAENERLNAELQSSLSELQALFEISDHIHASLDVDAAAQPVLETVARTLGLEACCMYVVEKSTDAVVFSASIGVPLDVALPGTPSCDRRIEDEDLELALSCMCPFDQPHMRLVFCAAAHDLERLSENDHLVLQAIGHEVAEAVENSQLYKLTKRMAVTDELTGLYNYRYLQQHITDEVSRAGRYKGFATLLMIDCDDFKAFNDLYGHVAGDEVLAELGHVFTDNVRDVDLVARYGGEEFSVLLPETDMMGGVAAAEKLRDAVAEHEFQAPYNRKLSVSIGLATYPTHGRDAESLLRAADDALYGAKNSGKNQVHTPGVYDGQPVW